MFNALINALIQRL